MPRQLPADILTAALAGYRQRLEEIDAHMAALRQRIGGRAPAPSAAPATAGEQRSTKPRLSPEGRARIIAAAKKRWDAVRKAKNAASAAPAKTGRRPARAGKRAAPRGRRKNAARSAGRSAAAKRRPAPSTSPIQTAPAAAETPQE